MWSLLASRDERLEEALGPVDICATLFAQAEFAVYLLRVSKAGELYFADANEGVAQLAGKPLSEVRGARPQDCLPQPIAECLISSSGKCLETGENLTYERTLDLPQGRMSWKTSLMPMPQRPGRPRHIFGLTRDITREAHLIETAKHNAALLRSLGIALPSAVYLLNLQTQAIRFIGGDSDERRQQWRKHAEDAGSLAAEQFFHPDDLARAEKHRGELAALADGEISSIDYRILTADGTYRLHHNRETVFRRNAAGEVEYVLGVSEDISEQERVQQEVRDLSTRILTLEINARRRLAQELHDSTGQHLVAAALALSSVQITTPESAEREDRFERLSEAVEDARRSIRDAQREIRVLSYLLHPPQLLSQGLSEAITDFAVGFGKRAALEIDVRTAPRAGLVDDETALHLFRVCQEALTNVYRHAGAKKVVIELDVDDRNIRLSVADDGVGFNGSELVSKNGLGVGLASMRDRVTRLGGSVHISDEGGGTTLVTTVPRSATVSTPRVA